MERFGIEWYEVGKWIIIPVRNINGELIGIRRRSLNPEEPKYMPICSRSLGDYSFNTGLSLYGLYENQDIIRKRQSCYLFEGEKSVLKCATWYNHFPCAACYSHNVGYKQMDLLIYNNFLLNLKMQESSALCNPSKQCERSWWPEHCSRSRGRYISDCCLSSVGEVGYCCAFLFL